MSTEPTVLPRPPFPTRVTTTWDNDVNAWTTDTNAAIASENAHQQWVREQTPAAIGALGLSCASEVPITGAISLDASAFGRMHVCSGTAADYTVTLPPVAGNAGKLLGVRISGACTKLVTLDGAGSENINSAATRVMWARESAVLLCDGAGWTKIAGKTIPMGCHLYPTAQQNIPTGAWTGVVLNNVENNIGGIGSTTTSQVKISRVGRYRVSANMVFCENIDHQTAIRLNGTATIAVAASAAGMHGFGAFAAIQIGLAAGDYLSLLAFQDSGASQNTYIGSYAGIYIEEIPQW